MTKTRPPRCHPMLFTAHSIAGIFAGRKWQTRRTITDPPVEKPPGYFYWINKGLNPGCCHTNRPALDNLMRPLCPYKVGDTIYIRTRFLMPKTESPGILLVTGNDVQRVQEINLSDARAEGIREYGHEFRDGMTEEQLDVWRNRSTIENYAAVWDEIHGKHTFRRWASNCWVWIIRFELQQDLRK